jgi:error-prone DNA polymerase
MLGIEALGRRRPQFSLAGIVRAHEAAKATGVRLIVGCRLDLADGMSVLVYPTDRRPIRASAACCRSARARPARRKCHLEWPMSSPMAKG